MSETRIKASDLRGKDICFLLDVDYQGTMFRFSSFPVELVDSSDGSILQYRGGLSDPDIYQQTELMGVDIEANSVPMELVFHDIDWMIEWLAGRRFDNSLCVISMITSQNGETDFTIQSKIVLFRGRSENSIVGTPEAPAGYIDFTISNDISISKKMIIKDHFTLGDFEFPSIREEAIGKIAPIVFGKIGPYPISYGNTIIDHNLLNGSPVYPIEYDTLYAVFIVCYGTIEATELRIYDSTFGNFVNPVETAVDSKGRIYSYVRYNVLGPNTEDNAFFPFRDDDQEYWAQWSEYDGAQLSPFTAGPLTGAGDICIYFLQNSGLEYDHEEWESLRSILNEYKFAGYINDPEVDIWSWLKDSIIEYLPIEVINGGQGLKPILNLYFYSDHKIHPHHHISESGEFEFITGIQPLDVEITNHLRLEYVWDGHLETFKTALEIDGNREERYQEAGKFTTQLSRMSHTIYGKKDNVVEIQHCYDFKTAQMIARNIIRFSALGSSAIDVRSKPHYGYIQLGEIIALSSEKLHFTGHLCQVISKRWEDNSWIFTLLIENNPLVNPNRIG